MDSHHPRKLLSESILADLCKPICYITAYCEPGCLTYCPTDCSCTKICLPDFFYDIPVPSPPLRDTQKSTRNPKVLITSLVSLSAVFLIVCFCVLYYRFHRRTQRRQPPSQPGDEFLGDDQGPILDHPIWYIRTTGLQQSIISSITVLTYKKGEGVVDGSDCSVCLSEFQDDETLRLLPKCSHAFHVSCIDTWLRSHTNCPLCRAPVVISGTLFQTGVVNSGSVEEERQVGFPDTSSSSGSTNESQSHTREIDIAIGGSELIVAEDVEGETTMQRVHPRRSASLDSLSAAKINVDICCGLGASEEDVKGGSSSSSSSSVRTSSNSCVSMQRSISWSAISLPYRHSRSHKTKAAVRSF